MKKGNKKLAKKKSNTYRANVHLDPAQKQFVMRQHRKYSIRRKPIKWGPAILDILDRLMIAEIEETK